MIKMVAKSGFMYARKTIRQVRNKFFPSEYELIKKNSVLMVENIN